MPVRADQSKPVFVEIVLKPLLTPWVSRFLLVQWPQKGPRVKPHDLRTNRTGARAPGANNNENRFSTQGVEIEKSLKTVVGPIRGAESLPRDIPSNQTWARPSATNGSRDTRGWESVTDREPIRNGRSGVRLSLSRPSSQKTQKSRFL